MFSRVVIVCCFLALVLQYTYAQQPVIVGSRDHVVEVQHRVELFIDSTGTRGIREIEKIYAQGAFRSPTEQVPNLTGTDGTIWFRLIIQNQLNEPLFLSFPEIFFEEITVYSKEKSGDWQGASTGFFFPVRTRSLPFNRYILKLENDRANIPMVVYGSIKAESKPPILLRMSLGSGPAISSESRKSELVSMAVIGILLIMLFYNFCLSLVISDSLFLSYCVYIISAVFLILWLSGFSFEWFWPDFPAINRYQWALGPYYLAQIWFVNKLLGVKGQLPPLYKTSFTIYFLSVLVMISPVMPPGFVHAMSVVIGALSPMYFLVCSLILAYRKEKIAFIFLIGWLPLLVVTVLNMLMISGNLPYHIAYDKHGMEVTLAWELVIFSLVLGYRFNRLRVEKLEMQHENLRIVSEQKSLLRKMVFEQTEEIMAQNDQLLRNQEEIKQQNDRLERQNKAYERLRALILKQNHELESAVQRRTVQLAHSNEELKRHLHQVEQFSFISAHNLRAPVARILGLASIFDRSKVIGKENVAVLDRIVACAKDLDIIIHDLGAILDTQKNTSEKSETIDLKLLLDKILNRYEAEVSIEGIHISINAQARYVQAVPAYLDSILSNLISNSIKYRSDQKPSFIRISTEELPSGWKLEVEDNGLGFDSKLLSKKVFEPFQRFHTHKEGKGLGMFLVKTQVTAMQGIIELHSEPNKGTHVTIIIPKRKLQKSA
ncbi:MAG TPA: sensor histidine kinase [Chryseosolibacter sp.]